MSVGRLKKDRVTGSGNTAGRPSNPVIGDTYYNGTLALLEIYDGTNWVPSSAPPGIPTVTATDIGTSRAYTSGAVNFSFVAGVNGGNPYGFAGIAILGGTTYTTGNTTTSSETISVGGPGTYSVSGTAYNGFGASPSSVAGNLAVTTVPDAPTSVSVGSATGSSIVVSWTAPNTGGKAITQYTVTPFIGATAQSTTTTSSTSVTVTGLSSATSYTFKVKATNDNGTGLDSTASASVGTQAIIDFLVVAGGGGGGGHNAAGGGAGGLRSSVTATGGGGTLESAIGINYSTNYTVTVGGGGGGGQNSGGANGSASVFSSITSTGGGGAGGGNGNNAAQSGGSGGGAVNNNTPGAGTTNQGYAGGQGSSQSNSGTGGGGAGAAGSAPGGNNGGNGGDGVAVSITGTSVTYAGGGGGSSYNGTQGAGGSGGGGSSAYQGGSGAGTVNTGGGGGGENREPGTAGAGGRGVVILKYPSSLTMGGGSGLTFSTATSDSFKITTFTLGTGTVSWS